MSKELTKACKAMATKVLNTTPGCILNSLDYDDTLVHMYLSCKGHLVSVLISSLQDPVYNYGVTLHWNMHSGIAMFNITKLTALEQLLSVIMFKYSVDTLWSVGREILNIRVKAAHFGVRLFTVEDPQMYRANIHEETLMLALKFGWIYIANGEIQVSKRSKLGYILKCNDHNMVDYDKWIQTQNTGISFNYIHPSTDWQNQSMY